MPIFASSPGNIYLRGNFLGRRRILVRPGSSAVQPIRDTGGTRSSATRRRSAPLFSQILSRGRVPLARTRGRNSRGKERRREKKKKTEETAYVLERSPEEKVINYSFEDRGGTIFHFSFHFSSELAGLSSPFSRRA